MKDREQLHDFKIGTGLFGQAHAVFKNSCPMDNTMDPVPMKDIVIEDGLENE